MSDRDQGTHESMGATSRRTLLRLGAIAVPAVVTLKPAFAQTNTSIMTCEIPVNQWVDDQGDIKAAGTEGAYAPPSRPYTGEEIRNEDQPSITTTDGKELTSDAFNAHIRYMNKMQRGTPGFTCFASIAARKNPVEQFR